MHTLGYPLIFGERQASLDTSEASYLDSIRRANRPVEDASFRTRTRVASRSAHINVGGVIVSVTAGSPIHIQTAREPQYTFLIPLYGSGEVQQGSCKVRLAHGNIIRCSYQAPLVFDCDHSSTLTIRTSIPLLLNALNIEDSHREKVTERLLDTDLEQLPPSIGSVDYHGAINSVLRMIDTADCNEPQLERIGFHRLLTGIIADLTLKADKRLTDL